MLKPRFFSVFALALSACSGAFFAAAAAVIQRVAASCWTFVTAVPAKFKQPRLEAPGPLVQLVQVCAHAAKLAKRERPVSFGTWRMCPSA